MRVSQTASSVENNLMSFVGIWGGSVTGKRHRGKQAILKWTVTISQNLQKLAWVFSVKEKSPHVL